MQCREKTGDRQILEACWPAGLAEMVDSRFIDRLCHKKKKLRKVEFTRERHPMSTSDLHVYTWVSMYTQIHTPTQQPTAMSGLQV